MISPKAHIMIALRACSPCDRDDLRRELLIQAIGVTRQNVDWILDTTLKEMVELRMIELYEMISPQPDDVPAYEPSDYWSEADHEEVLNI